MRDIVLESLQRELEEPVRSSAANGSFWARRKLLPEYAKALKAGAFSGGTDSAVILSGDRTSRENALL